MLGGRPAAFGRKEFRVMKNSLVWMVVVATFGSETLFAQRGEPVNSLARARATFTATDSNKDGKVTLDELKSNALPIQKADFDAHDNDKDGTWSRDEFLVYYRQVLVSGGQRAGDDLEGEVARIQALRKAKAAESGAKNGARATADKTSKVNPAEPVTIDDRLARAIDDLEKRAAVRQATRDDFERVRGAMLDRAKAEGAVDPKGEPDIQARFATALEALEKNAKVGNYSREEFNSLRALLVKRGREAAKGAGDAVATPTAQAVDIEARLQRALDELEKKAEARQATREDFGRVRDLYTQRAKVAMTAGDASTVAEENALAPKFSAAMDELEKQAVAGNWSREQFNALRQGLIRRARAAAGGAPGAVDAKQVDAMSASSKSSDAKSADSKGVDAKSAEAKAGGEGIEARFELALASLEQKALARGATREDFGRVRDMLEVRARQAIKGPDGVTPAAANDPAIAALVAKVQSALERLEKAHADGTIKAEDFAALRQMITQRARAAASNVGPAEARRAAESSTSTSTSDSSSKSASKSASGGALPPVGEKPVEAKPVDPKPAEQKPVDPKPVDPKPAPGREGKPAPVPPPEPPKGEEKPQRPSNPPHAELRTRS
jgi:hypothetical protein